MNAGSVHIDKAGRLVLPKVLRDQFNLLPGDKLRLSVEGNSIRLEPTSAGEFVRKGSMLIFTGAFVEPITTEKVNEILNAEREGRFTGNLKPRKK